MWPFDTDDQDQNQAPVTAPDAPVDNPNPQLAALSLTPDTTSDNMDPKLKDYLTQKYNLDKYTPDARKAIEDQNAQERQGPNLAAALSAFGAGLQGKDAAYAGQSVIKNQENARQAKLNQFDTNRAQTMQDLTFAQGQAKQKAEMDPDSPESKIAQSAARSMGFDPDLVEGLTAAKFKEMSPVMEKAYQAKLVADTRKDTAKSNAQAKADRDADKAAAEKEKTTAKAIVALKDDLDPNKARGGNLAKNQEMLNRSDRLKTLYGKTDNGDVRNLDRREQEELAIGLQAMLSGGHGSVEQVKNLVPQSARGDALKFKEWLLNEPTGLDQTEFVKKMAATVDREHQTIEDQLRQAQVQRLSAHGKLKKEDPDSYNQVLTSYGISPNDIDENGRYKPIRKTGNMGVADTGNQVKVVNGVTYKKVPGGWAPDQSQTAEK